MRRRRFNPKYRLGQKVAYEHPRIKSQMRGIIDEIDEDVYYVRDLGGYSDSVTPVKDGDILGVLDFQGYIVKPKPKRKKFLGLFNNPKSEMEDLIDRYEYIESRLTSLIREGPPRHWGETPAETKGGIRALTAGLCEIRERIKRLEVEGSSDFKSETYTRAEDQGHVPYADLAKNNPASRRDLVRKGALYADENEWHNVRDEYEDMADGWGGKGERKDWPASIRQYKYPEWEDEDFQTVYEVMEDHHYEGNRWEQSDSQQHPFRTYGRLLNPRRRSNPYSDDY